MKVDEEVLANIQTSLMDGRLQCWMLAEIKEATKGTLLGVCTTSVVEDTFARVKFLYIYTTTMFGSVNLDVWSFCLERLRAYGRKKGCVKIVTFTSNDRMLAVIKRFGGTASSVRAEMEI